MTTQPIKMAAFFKKEWLLWVGQTHINYRGHIASVSQTEIHEAFLTKKYLFSRENV